MKTFMLSILKISISITIASIFVILMVFFGIKMIEKGDKEAKKIAAEPYKSVSNWKIEGTEPISISFNAQTKFDSGSLYVRIVGVGYPDFLDLYDNKINGAFILGFTDSDGFKVHESTISLSKFTTSVNSKGEKTGISYQYDEYFDLEKYKKINAIRLGWILSTNAPEIKVNEVNANKTKKPVTMLDHCAPEISRTERLSRLAARGSVRQIREDSYKSGESEIVFIGKGDAVLFCQ